MTAILLNININIVECKLEYDFLKEIIASGYKYKHSGM